MGNGPWCVMLAHSNRIEDKVTWRGLLDGKQVLSGFVSMQQMVLSRLLFSDS